MRFFIAALVAAFSMFSLIACAPAPSDDEIVVYTSRHDHLIKPVFDAFTAETGIPIRYITDNAGALIARLEAEGARSPADLLITVDAGNLWNATQRGLLAKTDSDQLDANVPAHLRDPEGHWYGLTVRARTMVYSTERVDAAQLSSYQNLADAEWQQRLCLRSGSSVYNQSLVATLIERLGEAQTESIVRGWVNNLAAHVFPNDTAVMEAIIAGQCDVGIVNTYYYGRLKHSQPEAPIGLHFANQNDGGTHINISGAGITRNASHPEAALALLEWLTTDTAQRILADENREYPANPNVPPSEMVAEWGEFTADNLNVNVAGARQIEAVKLMDRAGFR